MREILVETRHADMLEHADRYDAVEWPLDVAIVLQAEVDVAVAAQLLRTLRCDRLLLPRKRDAGNFSSGGLGKIKPQTAKAATDIQRLMSLVDQQFGGDMALLGELRLLQALAGPLEIGAGILPIRVQKEIGKPMVQIVMACDILGRPESVVALMEISNRDARPVPIGDPRRAGSGDQVARPKLQKII